MKNEKTKPGYTVEILASEVDGVQEWVVSTRRGMRPDWPLERIAARGLTRAEAWVRVMLLARAGARARARLDRCVEPWSCDAWAARMESHGGGEAPAPSEVRS